MATLRYASDGIVLEPDQWRVQVGGSSLTPEPKVFELLCYLMRHTGRVVSKAELLDALWGGDVVGESVLTRCVSCARKLLNDDSKTPRFIRTFHGRGYEFIAPVSELPATAEGQGPEAGVALAPESAGEQRAQGERGFVGRSSEAQRLREAIRGIGAHSSDFVLLSGEAGIGKTRLLEEVTRTTPPGVDVHWGYCPPIEGAPPFLVWQQCFRSIVRKRTVKTALRAFGDAASEARRLLLGSERSVPEANPAFDSAGQRFRTFDAIAQGLVELARNRPLVLVLDDLHFADQGSLLLLEFLVQQRMPGLLLLASVRDAEPALDPARGATLAAIRLACRFEVTLSGLSHDEVRQFVELRFAVDDELTRQLHARTGGNPFFLSVLTLNRDAASGGQHALPTALRQAVSHRLSILERDCLALLRLAAVFGRELFVSVLARASQQGAEHCTRLLEAAVAARVIVASRPGEYRFVHDLVREVLFAELDSDARARAHLAIARALETLPEYQHARHAAMLAHHFAQGRALGGASRALDLSIRAGAYALRNFAYEEAIEQFGRASNLLSLAGEADPASEGAVLLDLGLAQICAGQREQGQATLQLAASKARELGAAGDLGNVALSLAPGLFAIEVGGYDPALVALLREALALLGAEDGRLRALLLARLALALYWADTFDERVAICAEAGRLAQQLGSDEVRAAVLTAQALALSRPANLGERRALTEQAAELCDRAADHQGLLLNRLHRATLLLEAGDLAAAGYEAEAFEKLAEQVKQPQAIWIARALRASRLLLDGRLAEVEALAGVCLQTGQRVRDHNALQTFGVHLMLVRVEQGRAAEVLDVLRNYALSYPRTVAWRAVYAFALSRSGQAEKCASEYASTKVSGFAQPDDLLWPCAMAWLAEVCHTQRDAEGARLLYERLSPYAGRFVVVGFAIACLGAVERYLGLLAVTMGDLAAARGHFERALAQNRAAAAMLPVAYTLYDYALVLRELGETERASGHLREAQALALDRDLLALQARIRALPPWT